MVVQSRILIVTVLLCAAVRLSTDTLWMTGGAITKINRGSITGNNSSTFIDGIGCSVYVGGGAVT
jgi:hypothetical protein